MSRSAQGYAVASAAVVGVGLSALACRGVYHWIQEHRPQLLFMRRYGTKPHTRHPHEATVKALVSGMDCSALRAKLACARPSAAEAGCLESLSYSWVHSRGQLQRAADWLVQSEVLSVDMEAHSVWTFDPLPCLLQVCARGHTFIVDLLALHDHMHLLKPAFEDPQILKLFHGGSSDIQWLQQLDLYPVNVLDTCELAQEAVKVQKLAKPGLGHVLKEVCGIDTDKALASSDWRRRPLTQSQLYYSILDVCFLQYIAASLLDLLMDTAAVPSASTRTPQPAIVPAGDDAALAPVHSDAGPVPVGDNTRSVPKANSVELKPVGVDAGPSDPECAPCSKAAMAAVVGLSVAETGCRSTRERGPAATGSRQTAAVAAKFDGGVKNEGRDTIRQGESTAGADAGGACDVAEQQGIDVAAGMHDGDTDGHLRVAAAWKRSLKLSLALHKPATCAQVAQVAAIRIAAKEEAQERASCKRRKETFPADPGTFRIVAAVCWWRTCVGHATSVSPIMVLPDRLVSYLLYKRPTTSWGVLACLRRWSRKHREKHAERLQASDDVAPGEYLERNPFAWYLDRWEPGVVTALACPWLSSLLNRACNPRSTLPVEVGRMEAAYQSRNRSRDGQARQGKPQQPPAAKKQESRADRKERTDEAAAQARARIIKKFSKKKPAYSNCRMLAQDGSELAACDLKKICWYVNKGLAEWLPGHDADSQQPTIQLNFQHKTTDQLRGADAGYYFEVKRNQCVGCGEAGHYLKYRIVPDCYRKNFPVRLKSHRSHDIVLLCIDCHDRAHTAAERLKRRIATTYNVPVQPSHAPPEAQSTASSSAAVAADADAASSSAAAMTLQDGDSASEGSAGDGGRAHGEASGGEGDADGDDETQGGDAAAGGEGMPGPLYVRKAALTLDRQSGLPEERRREFEAVIIKYLHGRKPEVGEALQPGDREAALLAGLGKIKRNQAVRQMLAAGQPCPTGYTVGEVEGRVTVTAAPEEQGGHLWHGRQVVALILAAKGPEGLQALVVAFRQVFMESVQPQALPTTWNVYHDAPREFGPHSIFQVSYGSGGAREQDLSPA